MFVASSSLPGARSSIKSLCSYFVPVSRNRKREVEISECDHYYGTEGVVGTDVPSADMSWVRADEARNSLPGCTGFYPRDEICAIPFSETLRSSSVPPKTFPRLNVLLFSRYRGRVGFPFKIAGDSIECSFSFVSSVAVDERVMSML